MKIKNIFFAAIAAITISSCIDVSAKTIETDIYTVQKGDTLWIISKKYKVGIYEVINANPQFKNPNLIYPGDKVYVPLRDKELDRVELEVVELVNKERAKAGLEPLKSNWQVSRVAQFKSNEMRDKNYFSHTSPTYGSPFDMLKNFNIQFTSAAENIAKGQTTAQAVMNSWMNSEGHRKNILTPSFTEIGVGHSTGNGPTLWTQIFIRS